MRRQADESDLGSDEGDVSRYVVVHRTNTSVDIVGDFVAEHPPENEQHGERQRDGEEDRHRLAEKQFQLHPTQFPQEKHCLVRLSVGQGEIDVLERGSLGSEVGRSQTAFQ
jgi:hypothetical protein